LKEQLLIESSINYQMSSKLKNSSPSTTKKKPFRKC
jgi:hypothetical protein